MPNTDKIPTWEETQEVSQDNIPKWEETSDVKKKDEFGVGLPIGESTTPDQASLLPGYQRILKAGKIPVNPFEKAALGQPAVDESALYTGTIPKEQKPLDKPSVYDQALEDTEKWYGQWPSPRKKIENFNLGAKEIQKKYQLQVDSGVSPESIQAAYDNELSQLAKSVGAIWENGEVKVPQAEIDKYEETYTRKLEERSAKIAGDKKNPYIKDVLGNLGSGSAGVLNTPYNLMAISEKAGNAMLGLAGVDPSTYWQDMATYMNENKNELAQNSQRYEDDILTLVKNGETGKAIGKAGLDLAQTLPMLSTLIMGNAAGATNTTLGFMGGSKSAEEYMSLNNRKDIGEFSKIVDAIGVGVSEILFEKVGTVKILEGIKKGITERGANVVRDELTGMLQTNMQRNVSLLMQGNSDMVREGVSEAMTQLSDNLIKKATVDPNIDIWEGVTDSAIVGGLIGKGINLSLNAANKVQTVGTSKAIKETLKQVPENYSLEAKEKIVPLILERDALKAKIENATEPIKKLYSPQIKVIDDEITNISAKEEGIELPKEEKPKEGEKKKPEATLPESEVKVSPEGITPLKEEKKAEKETEEEVLQTPETMMKDLLDQGYTPERAKEMLEMFGQFTEGYTYKPEEFIQAQKEGKVSIEEPSPEIEQPIVEQKPQEEPSDATRVREIEGQIQEGGNVRPEGEGISSQNLEQQPQAGTETGNEKEGLIPQSETPIKDEYRSRIDNLDDANQIYDKEQLAIGDYIGVKNSERGGGVMGFVKKIGPKNVTVETFFQKGNTNDEGELMELKVAKSDIDSFYKPRIPLETPEQVPQEKKIEIEPEVSQKLKAIASKIREGKISKIQGFKTNTPFGLAWDAGLEVLATTLEETADLVTAINKALQHIKSTQWYKGLTKGKQDEFDAKFASHINSELGADIKKIEPEKEVKEPRVYGIKKKLVPQEKIDETDIEKRTFDEMMDRGKSMVNTGEILPGVIIQEIIKKPRALQPDEVAALVYYKAQLDNNFDDTYDKLENAKESGNIENETKYRTELDAITKEIDDYHQMSLITAYEQSLAFRLRQMLLDNEYNLQSQINRYKALNNGIIPKEIEDKFKEYDRQLAEVNKKLRDLERNKEAKETEELLKDIEKSVRKPRQKKGKDLMAEGFQDLMQAIGGLQLAVGDKQVSVSQALVKIGKGLIDEGIATLENVIEKIGDYINEKSGGKAKIKVEDYRNDVIDGIKESKGKPEIVDGKLKIPKDIIRDYVASGMDDINEIVKAIKKDYDLEATDREIRDAITDYGKAMSLNQEEIEVKVRELKRIGRTFSGMEDVINDKKKPLRSGLQRDKLTDRERRMQKELREAMKELPQTEEETAKAWKSALDGVKSRLKNQIADIQHQIDTGEKTPKRKGIEYDTEAKSLQEQRDGLREILQRIEGKPEISDEQKVRIAIGSAERWADEYERRIKEKDFSPFTKKSTTPITPELEAAKKRMADMKSALKDMMDIQGETEKRRLEVLKRNMNKSIAEYKRRLKEGDYSQRKTSVKPQMDREALHLEIARNAIKDKFDIEMEKVRLKNRPLTEKIEDTLLDVINLPKSLLASADLSAPLRQGAILTFANPKSGGRAFVEMFRQAFSEKRAEKWIAHVKANPRFNIIRQSKLYISEPTAKLSAKEEQFMTNIAHKIPVWKYIVKGSERAYVGYLNKLRVDVFTQGADYLQKQGYNFQNNPEVFKSWADFVNNATGRGSIGALEGAAPVLNAFFFAPRLVASRFNLLNPVKYYKMPKEVRKMALRNMGTFIGVGSMIIALAAAAGMDVEDDPRSADFGKMRYGDLRFDIWAGFQQVVRMMSQVISGQRKSSTTGVIRNLSAKEFPFQTRFDVITQFFRGKLAPIPSLAVDVLVGESMLGEEMRIENVLKEKTIPIYLQDMKEIYDELGISGAVGAGIPSLFGVGVQYYTPKKKTKEQVLDGNEIYEEVEEVETETVTPEEVKTE